MVEKKMKKTLIFTAALFIVLVILGFMLFFSQEEANREKNH